MTSSSNTTTIETQQIQQQQQQQAIESTGTTIMNTNSNNNSDRSISSNIKISSIITPNTKKEVSFENTENIVFIEYEQSDSTHTIDELWYTNSELRKCRNDYIRNIKSHHRYKKRQQMKNRVEIAWRSSRLFIIKYKKIRKPVSTTRLQLKQV
ncbi:hypothetical protein FRACYDRAFT_233511 [Fragilariopsis cylindrus CCMP1102]|uniref:Uncharacterized protein n=1 Tax=Fragilariopsis cylindrus CCMP1102 TaxID=635003 RepID=A0A1E7FYW3_9STRA|nr:hypothetical protein FRACYDRAFT_233511 [Fragilariopsis cylindrus CCMP1102]|eukprot:OEU23339.1 hypothetical protein FRACYDRAFT_233511 [Fragilariopsis cylindrus CCMP1102]